MSKASRGLLDENKSHLRNQVGKEGRNKPSIGPSAPLRGAQNSSGRQLQDDAKTLTLAQAKRTAHAYHSFLAFSSPRIVKQQVRGEF